MTFLTHPPLPVCQCRFAHVTEEVIYHPSKYKTQLCSHATDSQGCCMGYGAHCAKAHGEEDRRQAVYEVEEGQVRRWSLNDIDEFVVPEEEREQELLFYQFVYKTRKCSGFPYNCQCDGLDYHRDEERRRGPAIRYAAMACPSVKPYLNAEWGDPNVDCSGRHRQVNQAAGKVVEWDCEYSHTLLELMYHPQVYKTSPCDHFDEHHPTTWKCVWKRRCAHAHGKADVKSKETAAEEWKVHLQLVGPAATQRRPSASLPPLLQPSAPKISEEEDGVKDGETALIPPALHSRGGRRWSAEPAGYHYIRPASAYRDDGARIHATRLGLGSSSPLIAPSTWSTLSSSHNSPSQAGLGGDAFSTHNPLPDAKRRLSLFDLSASSTCSPSLWASPSPSISTGRVPPVLSQEVIARMHVNAGAATAPPALPTDALWSNPAQPPASSRDSFPSALTSPVLHPFGQSNLTSASPPAATDATLVTCKAGGRLRFNPQQLLREERDGTRLYTGESPLHGQCGVLIIDRTTSDDGAWSAQCQQVHTLTRLSRCALLPHFVRYLDYEEDNEKVAVALELSPDVVPLHVAISTLSLSPHSAPHFQPVSLVHQLFTSIHALHSHGLVHGELSPRTLGLHSSFQSVQLSDVPRYRPATEEGRSADVYAVGCVAYFLLSAGRTPFRHAVEVDQWEDAELMTPLDTSPFHPTAAHLIAHVLVTPAGQRMTAAASLHHPLFWSTSHAVRFLCAIVQLINTQSVGPTAPLFPTQVAELCAELDELAPSIFPATTTSQPEWLSAVHSTLYQRYQAGTLEGQDIHSVVSLVRFISSTLDQLLGAPLLSCLVHALFHLDHRPNCTRPRRHSSKADEDEAMSAVGHYFFDRFPSLVISLYHLTHKRWSDHPTLKPLFWLG